MTKRTAGTFGITALVALAFAAPAVAAPTWHAPQTVKVVRGIPDPDVGVASSGVATIVFADAPPQALPGVYLVRRVPNGSFGTPQRVGDGSAPRVAVAPDGTTAIAWRDGKRIETMFAPPVGRPLSEGVRRTILVPGGPSEDLRIGIAGDGRATLVWKARDGADGAQVQLRTATVAPDGSVGPIATIGPAGICPSLTLSVNGAGDAVAFCVGREEAYVRPPGGGFAIVPFGPPASDIAYVTLDGAGAVTAVRIWNDLKGSDLTEYRIRARGGEFGAPRPVSYNGVPVPFALVSQERRSVAVWSQDGRLAYAVRPAGGGDFGPSRRSEVSATGAPLTLPVAPLGPLPLLFSASRDAAPPSETLVGMTLGADDVLSSLGRREMPGVRDFPIAMASSEHGLAAATWEQRCGDGFAVMAMVLDERRGTSTPPCQDRRAPKIVVRPKRARLAGRTVRVRIGCDERCRTGVRTRVLGAGSGRPLATAKTKRAALLGARRFRTFKLRLSPTEAVRLSGALAVGRRVTVRLALPVRDSYENGAVRRVAVPLRR